jgi:hypothetical protein
MSKKTQLITYNLADRGRSKDVGTDRSDVDIKSMVDRINASDTQELVNSGDMFGYYGHELRGRFGMNPPDVWLNPNTGESIRIEPAIRTVKLSADNDGNVSHQQEFLDTDTGKYSERLYANNAGGFSSAVMRKMGEAGKYGITSFDGFDYVRQPNYNTNRGGGMFDSLFWLDDSIEMAFDSLDGITPEHAAIKSALETAILHQYDSIANAKNSDAMVQHYQKEVMAAQDAFVSRQQALENIRERRASRDEEIYDSMVCPSVSFDSMAEKWASFDQLGTSDRDLRTTESVKKAQEDGIKHREERTSIFKRR